MLAYVGPVPALVHLDALIVLQVQCRMTSDVKDHVPQVGVRLIRYEFHCTPLALALAFPLNKQFQNVKQLTHVSVGWRVNRLNISKFSFEFIDAVHNIDKSVNGVEQFK